MTIETILNTSIAKNGNESSNPVNVDSDKVLGYYSVQVDIAGTGTVNLDLLVCNDGTNYVTPAYGGSIATSYTATNNHAFIPLDIPMCHSFKIKVTEQNVNPITSCKLTLAWR